MLNWKLVIQDKKLMKDRAVRKWLRECEKLVKKEMAKKEKQNGTI